MAMLLAIFVIAILLVSNEIWWHKTKAHGEVSRKFIHITAGSFVAFWPLFLSWQEIRILSAVFLISVIVSKQLGLFRAIHSVQRPTWGELFFAAAVGLVTFITNDPAVYTASLLLMSLADGLAAIVGHHFGKRSSYLILGHTKSVVGTLVFFVVSLAILTAVNPYFPMPMPLLTLVAISAAASLIENLGIIGLDNLLVPTLVALILVNA